MKIIFHSHNAGVVYSWQNLASTNGHILELMRRILVSAAVNNFTLTIKHIAGIDNSIADALSFFDISRYPTIAPFDDEFPCKFPNFFEDLGLRNYDHGSQ